MEIDIAGEDIITQEIIERLVHDLRPDITIKNRFPVRGGQIKNAAPKYNLLNSPLILLTDLDQYHCAPTLITDWLGGIELNPNMLFRVALEESETWLMADREGFSKWLGVSLDTIPLPQIINKKSGAQEVIFPIKPSLHMMLHIVPNSSNEDLKSALTPNAGAKKGPGYNSAIIPFIKDVWDFERAAIHSDSLQRTISRISNYKK